MGIKDLLRFLKPFTESVHIKKYAGKRVGIDAYSWLHKGSYSCSMELCLNLEGDGKLRYLQYFMHRINLLRHYKVTPVVVFDGGNIPCKALTERQRESKRNENLDLAMKKLKEGSTISASECFQRAVTITPLMAHQLIQILKLENIEYVVAPYEADAQLAYLSSLEVKHGIEAVITEDSDLLAYGCPAIVFKMDKYGNGDEILLDKVFDSLSPGPSFQNFDQELFTGMCVLAGCDFLPSVPGIGIVRAHSLVSKYRNLDRVLSVLKSGKAGKMPCDYKTSFKEAIAVFQHALIFDVDAKRLKHMKPLSQNLQQLPEKDLGFLGPYIPQSEAFAIARGNLDPITMKAFEHLPSPSSNMESIIIEEGSGHPQQSHRTAMLTQESCFTVFPSEINNNIATVASMENVQQKQEVRYSRDAFSMAKMVPCSEVPKRDDSATVSSLNVPNNNPFKKRKFDEISTTTEEFPEVSVFDEPIELKISPMKSPKSVNSKLETSNGKPKKLRNGLMNSDGKHKITILNFFPRV